jgi:serine/threonine protein phosphatase PrpC
MPLKVTVGTVTDRGLNPKRVSNEDRLLALPQARLFLVADGVGGRRGGQVASQTVVDVFKQAFSEQLRQGNDLLTILKQTITLSNRSIFDSASELIDLRGMATTVALVAALNDNRAIIGHVGDSRVYRFDGRNLICETEDHSEVNDAIRAGTLSAAQAAHHPRRNVINRAIGAEPDVEADFKIVPLNERTSFLLCSDGITRHVSDAEMTELMRSHQHPQKLCTQLKEICFERGAEDNLTAVIVDFGERSYSEAPTRPAIARLRAASGAAHNSGSRFQVEFGNSAGALDDSPEAPVIDRYPAQAEHDAVSDSARLRQTAARRSTETAPPTGALPPKEPAKTNSNITFWPKPQPAAAEKPAPPAVSAKPSLAFRGRDFTLLGFYIFLLAVAFGVGRNYDELLSWVTGEPVAVLNQAASPGQGNDPELAAARALFEERRFDKARERLAQLAAAKPGNAELLYWLGRSESELKLYPDALKHLGEAARLDANLPHVYIYLALAQLAGGDKKMAEESLKKATQ